MSVYLSSPQIWSPRPSCRPLPDPPFLPFSPPQGSVLWGGMPLACMASSLAKYMSHADPPPPLPSLSSPQGLVVGETAVVGNRVSLMQVRSLNVSPPG